MEQRTCPVCREQFTPRSGNQRFCCKQHSKAYQNAKKRGTLERLLNRGSVGQPFDCARCGRACVPGEDGIAPHARKFCGYDCKHAWHKTHRPWKPTDEYLAKQRRTAKRRKARKAQRRALNLGPARLWIAGRCDDCEVTFVAPRATSWIAHYHSATCAKRASRSRRRARKQEAFVEEVRRPTLFERDNWTCQLCGDPVDPDLRYPDPMVASVDHIVPLSQGGEHSYRNTQLAHALCNSLKGDREAGSMMFAASRAGIIP